PRAMWSAIPWEDNEPGAQTVHPGAVGPVRELLGGRTSPAALFQPLNSFQDSPRVRLRRALLKTCRVRGCDGRYLPSTSFQNSATGFSLIRSSPANDRTNSARSAR